MNPYLKYAVIGLMLPGLAACDSKEDIKKSQTDGRSPSGQIGDAKRRGSSGGSAGTLALGGLFGEEVAQKILHKDLKWWHEATAAEPVEKKKALTLALYQLMKEKEQGWTLLIPASMREDFPGLGRLCLNDFLETPALILPPGGLGWRKADLVQVPKYWDASAVAKLGDPETMELLWKSFPDMGEGDQLLVSMSIDSSEDLSQVSAIVKAAASAKSREIKDDLMAAASRIPYFALKDPAKAAAAAKVADELTSRGIASAFLVEAMEKQRK